jgi:hypothetical protein
MNEAAMTVAMAVLSSVFTGGIMYGMFKAKLSEVERSLANHEHYCEKERDKFDNRFVSKNEFEAVVKPIRRALETLEHDVKEILKVVSR